MSDRRRSLIAADPHWASQKLRRLPSRLLNLTVPLAPEDGILHPLQQAFRDAHALQCGYCTPGILMTLTAFLEQQRDPSEVEVRQALSGNLCRCTGYQHIV